MPKMPIGGVGLILQVHSVRIQLHTKLQTVALTVSTSFLALWVQIPRSTGMPMASLVEPG